MGSADPIISARLVLLGLPVCQLLLLAGALAMSRDNPAANRSMAGLLLALSGILTPFVVEFAGLCQRWPRLCLVPFAISFSVGPLVWFYACAVTHGRLPARYWLHLLPAAIQFLFMSAGLLLPASAALRWSSIVTPVAAAGTLVGIVTYCLPSLAMLRDYHEFVAERQSNGRDRAARWLSRVLAASTALLAFRACYQTFNLFHALDDAYLFGPYVVMTGIGIYIGVESWRHAAMPLPCMTDCVLTTPGRNWRAEGEAWATQAREAGWHTDPELSLSALARRLGTNPTYLSRALNDGLGINFSSFVNRLRAEEVAKMLRDGARGDLLDLALEAGFRSKASFNRAFRAAFGTTASEYRRRHGSKHEK